MTVLFRLSPTNLIDLVTEIAQAYFLNHRISPRYCRYVPCAVRYGCGLTPDSSRNTFRLPAPDLLRSPYARAVIQLYLQPFYIWIILQNLLICTVVFYTVLCLAQIICFILLRLDSLDELGPFDFKTSPSWSNKKYLANLISLESTFLVSSILFVLIVEEWIWDYGCTVTLIHIIVVSMVNMEFPVMAHWWFSIGIGLTAMICGGQILAYLLYKNNFIYPDLDDF
ncbi:transmembrane protein 244 [Hyla sarda]|uniref:transmembrane protein 244 n=1 Tax=Hyla sarda TaxID=327740 RepID=UPI0024C2A196|nr:transmembrane protein 244 [Hyla sarda]